MRFPLFAIAISAAAFPALAQDAPPFAAFDIASEPILNDPHDLDIGPDGMLYVADKFNNRITVLDPETLEHVRDIAVGQLPGVHDIHFGADGRAVIAVTGQSVALVVGDLSGEDLTVDLAYSAPRTEGALMHSSGVVFAMASGIGVLAAFDGENLLATAEGHLGAHDVAEDLDGNIWVADNRAGRLVKYTPALQRLQVLDHAKFGFVGPRYLDVDDFGRLIVADQDAHRVLMIDPDGPDGGTLLGVVGTGTPGLGEGRLDDPEGIKVWNNSYFISDSDNNRIVRYSVVLN